MNKFLNSKYGLLIFSLLCGSGYFLLIMGLMAKIDYSYLLGIFFMPAVICGGALCIFKMIRNMHENNDEKKIKCMVYLHIVLIVFSVVFCTVSYL